MRSPKDDRQRPRRRGFDDDHFYGNTPAPSFPGFGGGMSSTSPEHRATVKWYNPEKGFGFVELSDGTGDVFLHASALQAYGAQTVSPGSIVQVRVGQGQKGRQVDQVLSIEAGTEPPPPRSHGGGSGGGGGGGRGPRHQVDLSTGREMTGIVKWYNPDKGFGFITPKEGGKDVFVHATVLERAGLPPLQEGQAVRALVVKGNKGDEVGSISLD